MTSKTHNMTSNNPIIVTRLIVVPHFVGTPGVGSTAALCAPLPPESYPCTAPVEYGPCAPAGGSRASIFSAIGESLLGDDFTEQTRWFV